MSIFDQVRARTDSAFSAGVKAAGEFKAAGGTYPLAMLGDNVGGYAGVTSDSANRSQYEEQYKYAKRSWSYASIRPTANRIAEQRLLVARTTRRRTERSFDDMELKHFVPDWVKSQAGLLNLEPLDSHPLLSAVQNPNPHMVEWMLGWATGFSLEATGASHWWFRKVGAELQIWPVPSHWIKPTAIDKWFVGVNGDFSNATELTSDEICRFYIPDPSNPLLPMSSLGAASTTILAEDAIQRSQERSFQAPMPAYAFTIGERTDADGVKRRPELTREQRGEIDEMINRMMAGPQNRAKAILLDALITNFHRLTPPNAEMDFQQSGKQVARKIQQIFGTNPILMGEVENANRASSVVAEKLHLDTVVNPRLAMIGQVLTAFAGRSKLINDKTVVAFYKPVVSRDPDIEQRDWAFASNRGMVSDDDFRVHRLGLPKKKNGAGKYARINNQFAVVEVEADPTTTPVIVAPQQMAGGANGANGTNGARVPSGGQGSDTGDSTANNPDGVSEPGGDSSDQNRNIGKSFDLQVKDVSQKSWSQMHQRLEKLLADDLAGVIQRSVEIAEIDDGLVSVSVGDSLSAAITKACRSRLVDAAASGAALQESLYKASAKLRRKDVSDILFGLDGRVAVEIERYLDSLFGQSYWSEMGSGVEKELRAKLEQFQRDGLSQSEIRDGLISAAEGISARRAMTIATTETTGAMNAGSYFVRMDLVDAGAVSGHEWNSIIDDRTRGMDPEDNADHVVMDGVVVGPRELFNVGGEMARFPGDYTLSAKNRANCRCFSTAVSAFE